MDANGNIVTEELNLPLITGVSLNIAGQVTLTPATTQRITITASDNVISSIGTRISEGIWIIEPAECITNIRNLSIVVETPLIENVVLAGSGDISSTGAFSPAVAEILLTGSGNIDLEMEATEVRAVLNGSGSITVTGSAEQLTASLGGSGSIWAFDLPVDAASVNIQGSGDVEVSASDSLDVDISGSGTVTFRGEPNISQRITGSGEIRQDN